MWRKEEKGNGEEDIIREREIDRGCGKGTLQGRSVRVMVRDIL